MTVPQQKQLDRIENAMLVLDAKVDDLSVKVAELARDERHRRNDEENRRKTQRAILAVVIGETIAVLALFATIYGG